MQVHEKVARSWNTVFFQWFVALEGRKVGSLKRRVRSHVARWEMKNYTLLWREAHVQVKMYKAYQVRSTVGSLDVDKVHAVVARSTCRSQNAQSTMFGPLLEVEMSKKCTPFWREAHFQVKMCKTHHVQRRPFLEVEMSKKCTLLWREAHFEVKMWKAHCFVFDVVKFENWGSLADLLRF